VIKLSIEDRIINLLKENRWGLTAKEIAEKMGVSRLTVSKYLEKLKAAGVVKDRKIGAYRLWYLTMFIEERRKLIPRRIINAIGRAFLKVFKDEAYEIALKVGNALADDIIDLLNITLQTDEGDFITQISDVISMISEGVKSEGIRIGANRGILRVFIEGEYLNRDTVKLVAYLLKGVISSILAHFINKSVEIGGPFIRRENANFEIIIEMKVN